MTLRTTSFIDGVPYGFEWLRTALEAGPVQEGVLNMGGAGTDFKVTAAVAGLLRADIAAGVALVKGDTGTPGNGITQGLYTQVNDASIPNAVTFAAAHATLPRIDGVFLTIKDSSDLGSAGNTPTLNVVTGIPTSGATLDNRNGAQATPSNSVRLADVLIPAASTVVVAGNIRDRRPWARGASWANRRTAGNYVVAAAAAAVLDATNFYPRLEVAAGNVVTVSLATAAANTVAGNSTNIGSWMDGAWADSGGPIYSNTPVGGYYGDISFTQPLISLAAGSHLLGIGVLVGAGTSTILANTSQPLGVHIREHIAPNASNT